jgi:hypothetical protein
VITTDSSPSKPWFVNFGVQLLSATVLFDPTGPRLGQQSRALRAQSA